MDQDLNKDFLKDTFGMDMKIIMHNAEMIMLKGRSQLGLMNYLAVKKLYETVNMVAEQIQEANKTIEKQKEQIKDLNDRLNKTDRIKRMQFEALKALKQETSATTWRDALSSAALELSKEGLL